MQPNETRSNRLETSGNSPFNALDFAVRQIIKGMISTALPVKVVAVYAGGASSPAGYVDVLPLVCETDAQNRTIQPVTLYRVPYSRIQGGVAALVIDPVVGDIGLAVFAMRDSSNVTAGTSQPVQPGSFRLYDQADGFYIGGFVNQPPSCFVELTQGNSINIRASGGVNVFSPAVTVTGDVIAGGISLMHHTHPGDSGGTTGQPN